MKAAATRPPQTPRTAPTQLFSVAALLLPVSLSASSRRTLPFTPEKNHNTITNSDPFLYVFRCSCCRFKSTKPRGQNRHTAANRTHTRKTDETKEREEEIDLKTMRMLSRCSCRCTQQNGWLVLSPRACPTNGLCCSLSFGSYSKAHFLFFAEQM